MDNHIQALVKKTKNLEAYRQMVGGDVVQKDDPSKNRNVRNIGVFNIFP